MRQILKDNKLAPAKVGSQGGGVLSRSIQPTRVMADAYPFGSPRRSRVVFRIIAFGLFILALAPLFLVHTQILTFQFQEGTKYLPILDKKGRNAVTASTPNQNPVVPRLTNAKALAPDSVDEASKNNGQGSSHAHSVSLSDHKGTHRWLDGCYHGESSPTDLADNTHAVAGGIGINNNRNASSPQNHRSPPSGIVVVLATATDDPRVNRDTFRRICTVVPTQIEYFLEPQGLDMLFIVQEERGWTAQSLISCLKLYTDTPSTENGDHGTSRTWKNLDGSTLTATPFYYDKGRNGINQATIYVATMTTSYPKYIQEDPSILQHPITPKSCEAPRKYIQATRWYTHEMLNLGILNEYDYFLKIDTDVLFVDSVPFHLLQDLNLKGAVFGHTAEYHPHGSKTCTQGIRRAIQSFTAAEETQQDSRTSEWRGTPCSSSPEIEGDFDFYYTNFIIGKTSFWQSPWVLKLSGFLNEYPEGFFTYRWTDQIFWHNAMGLFLRNYSDFVVDYTTLRCMPDPNCWFSSYNFKRYGQDAWHKCDNGGYFLHPKDYVLSAKTPKRNVSTQSRVLHAFSQPLFQSTYRKDCSATKRDKQP